MISSKYSKTFTIVKRKIWKLRKLIESISFFYFLNLLNWKAKSNSKSVYLNLKDGYLYNRYYYILAKYFLIEGYTVYLPKRIKLIYSLNTDLDGSFIFKEKFVILGHPSSEIIEINDQIVNPDYFNFLKTSKIDSNDYYIPLGQHPFIYFKGYWNKKISKIRERKNSIFLAGNFNNHVYGSSDMEIIFNIKNRINLYKRALKSPFFSSIKSQSDLDKFLLSGQDNKLLIIDRINDFAIHPANIRYYVGQFNFLLGLPGFAHPLCHNIFEAMSVGTIPILQEMHAVIFKPELENGVNCITFSKTEDLDELISMIFLKSTEEINFMRNNVIKYHNDNCTPEVIVENLVFKKYSNIYMLAGVNSVKILREG